MFLPPPMHATITRHTPPMIVRHFTAPRRQPMRDFPPDAIRVRRFDAAPPATLLMHFHVMPRRAALYAACISRRADALSLRAAIACCSFSYAAAAAARHALRRL